jgi:hypothetical protein
MAVQSPPKGVSATALYCYGVVDAGAAKSQRKAGLGQKAVEPVRHGDVAALTSEVPAGRVRARRNDLLTHLDVLGTAFENGTVLPLRFGIVFDNEQSLVEEFLRPRHDELVALLSDLRDRVELRVSAHYREDAILAELIRTNPRIAELREATRGEKAAELHPLLLELGELVARELQARTHRDVRTLLERLRRLALREELDEEPIEYQLLRGSFLVERRRVRDFDAVLETFAADHAGAIDVKLVGPLPPHSFVGLTHEERR